MPGLGFLLPVGVLVGGLVVRPVVLRRRVTVGKEGLLDRIGKADATIGDPELDAAPWVAGEGRGSP